jgi:signal transduction histidine kinase
MRNSVISMRLRSQSHSSLPRILLILEWVLLGLVAIAQFLIALKTPTPVIINGAGLGIFAALGLIQPQRRSAKLIYTLVEFGLIFGLVFWETIPLPAMLLIVLVIRNCVLLQGRDRALVTGLAFLGCVITQTYRLFYQTAFVKVPLDQVGIVWIAFFIVYALVILFLHLLVDAALKEQQAQEQLRQYASQIEELATVQERNRIARDIHDSLGHSLTVFGIHLEAALRLLKSNPTQAEALLMEIKQLNSTTLQEVRQSVSALRSDPLQARSLEDAIADLITEFHRSTTVLPTLTMGVNVPLSKELKVVIYRIVQESLTNIRKYAAATQVKVSIIQFSTLLEVQIEDNGKGFDRNQNTTGFGLRGMQERTLAVSGKFEIITAPNQGCQIKVLFPIEIS